MLKKFIIKIILSSFIFNSVGPIPLVHAENLPDLPPPGQMILRSSSFKPLQLKGIIVNPKKPLRFDFVLDTGNSTIENKSLKNDITRLAKYFLTCLTVPEEDLWVNLSPYEKNRIIPDNFGVTLMGKDLLTQDYLLKQIMASLSYPENELGKIFWQKVYKKAYELYGTTEIPINTFNKVWIFPKKASVYARDNTAFILDSQLDVMLEADYKSFVNHKKDSTLEFNASGLNQGAGAYSQIFREVILPQLRQEVNEGKNFEKVRQVFSAMILAVWFKKHLKDSLLGKIYIGQNKVKGVDISDRNAKLKIYKEYLKAYKKCVYNYIKEDYDPVTTQKVVRKYTSGGFYFAGNQAFYHEYPEAYIRINTKWLKAGIDLSPIHESPAQITKDPNNSRNRQFWLKRSVLLPVFLAVSGFIMTPLLAQDTAIGVSEITGQIKITESNIEKNEVKLKGIDKHLKRNFFMHAGPALKILGERNFIRQSGDGLKAQHEKLLEIKQTMLEGSTSKKDLPNKKIPIKVGYEPIKTLSLFPEINPVELQAILSSSSTSAVVDTENPPQENNSLRRILSGAVASSEPIQAPFLFLPDRQSVGAQSNFTSGIKLSDLSGNYDNISKNAPDSILKPRPVLKNQPSRNTLLTPRALFNYLVKNGYKEAKTSNKTYKTDLVSRPVAPLLLLTEQPAKIQTNLTFKIQKPVGLGPNLYIQGNTPQRVVALDHTAKERHLDNPSVSNQLTVIPTGSNSLTNKPSQQNDSRISSTSNPPKKSLIRWGLYGGLAISGILLVRYITPNKKPSQKNRQNADVKPVQKQRLQLIRGGGKADPALLSDTRTIMQRAIAVGKDSKQNGKSVLKIFKANYSSQNILTQLITLGLSGYVSGWDPTSMVINSFLVQTFYAGHATVHLWAHEMGHMVMAMMRYPFAYKEALNGPNMRGNWTLSQWLAFFSATLSGEKYEGDNPYVSFFKNDYAISLGGIGATIVFNSLAVILLAWQSVSHIWMVPFLGVAGLSAVASIRTAIMSDIHGAIQIAYNKFYYPCDIAVHCRIGTRNNLAREGYKKPIARIKSMMYVGGDRGLHSAGIVWIGPDGQVILEKQLEALRGPNRDSIAYVTGNLSNKLPSMEVASAQGDEYIMDAYPAHTRLASGGPPERSAAHPHVGPKDNIMIFKYRNGKLVEESTQVAVDAEVSKPVKKEKDQVAVAIGHNGDNDKYKPFVGDSYIDKLPELRAFATRLVGYKGVLAKGDSPIIPLLIHYHLGMGNPDSSAYFSHTNVHYKNINDIDDDYFLTDEEKALAGQPLRRGILHFEKELSRFEKDNPDFTLKNFYVNDEDKARNPGNQDVQRRWETIQEIKEYLVSEYTTALKEGLIPEKIARHWRGSDRDEIIKQFVNLAVYKFFTGDRETATLEYLARSEGTYGLVIRVTTEPNGITLVSRTMGMVYGRNLEHGYLDASSDPYGVLQDYEDGSRLETLVYLQPQGMGQVANFYVHKKTGALRETIYSMALNRYLTEDEISKLEHQTDSTNSYWQPLHAYRDPRKVVMEDTQIITPAIANLVDSFDDSRNSGTRKSKQPYNYQSGMNFFKNLFSLWIYQKMEERLNQGGVYAAAYKRMEEALSRLMIECQTHACTEAQKDFLKEEKNLGPVHSRFMAIFKNNWLYQDALDLADKRIRGVLKTEDLLNKISGRLFDRVDELENLLSINRLTRAEELWQEEGKRPSVGREGIFFAGDENSDDGPRASKKLWRTLFPNLPVRFSGSDEILEHERVEINDQPPALIMLTGKAGGNYNTSVAQETAQKEVDNNRIWVVTGTPYSPLSFNLGQRIYKDAPFLGHAFYTGDHWRAQTEGASASLVIALHNLLPVFLALQFNRYCPHEKPFGLDLGSERVDYLERLFKHMMTDDARRITGFDERGDRVITKANTALEEQARFLTHRFWETPLITFFARSYGLLTFLGGGVIRGYLWMIDCNPGEPIHTWSGTATAVADWLLIMTLPYFLTLVFRHMTNFIPWVLQGPPPNMMVVAKDGYAQVQEMFGRVGFSRAFQNWGTQVLGERVGRALARLGPSVKRGTLIISYIPATPTLRRSFQGTIQQLKLTLVGLMGTNILRSSGYTITTSRGPFNDPTRKVSNNNVDIEGTEYEPPEGDKVLEGVFENFDAWGHHIAAITRLSMFFYRLTFGGRAWEPKKVNNALSLTTESGTAPPSSAMITQVIPKKAERQGGITMSSRFMQMNIIEEKQRQEKLRERFKLPVDNNGFSPNVSGIVKVTPDMLKSILGEAYLN